MFSVKYHLLIAVSGIVNLLPNVLERFHSFRHFFETPIDLTWKERAVRVKAIEFNAMTERNIKEQKFPMEINSVFVFFVAGSMTMMIQR